MNNIYVNFNTIYYGKFSIIVLSLFILACSNNNKSLNYESGKNLVGLASIITLEADGKNVTVADYFVHPELIDSISLASGKVALSANKDFFEFYENISRPIDVLKIYSGDTTFSIVVKKSAKINTQFTFPDPDKKYALAQIAGDVNQWNPQLGIMDYDNGSWKTSLWLAPGLYQYQIVLDNEWALDPNNPDSVDNNVGGYNSLKVVNNVSDIFPELSTASFNGSSFTLSATNTTNLIALWQNQEIPSEQINSLGNKYTIHLPDVAKKIKRSFIRVLATNKTNMSNDILIPLEYGKVLNNPAQLLRTDWHSSILYFMMVDRFNNGDSINDSPLKIPEVHPKADYFGGDIKGITQKIKSGYFTNLGVNSIWLSPIVQNPLGAYGLYPTPKTKFSAYHGYWPVSFNKIDFRLGNPNDLKELVALAHEKNLNVLIDFVANHVHKEHPLYKEHPEWATDLYLPDGSLNTERWDEYRLTTWFGTFLPTLDLTNPELTDILTDSAVFWINEYDLDGFRHDATKHVPEYFWRELTKKLKKEVIIKNGKTLYQIGETYGSKELIASYVNSGEMDAQFDFGIYDNALASFAREDVSFKRLQTSLSESFKYYGYHHLMGNISGNQDKPRFMAYAGGDLKFDEDSKLAGWTRDITVTNPLGYEKLKSFMAFNLTIPGIPVIYYGDEIGITGANDPDNRRQMRFDLSSEDEKDVKATVAHLTKLRRSNMEFCYGDFKWLIAKDDLLVYARTYFNDISIIAFNKSTESQEVQVKLPMPYAQATLFDFTKTEIENTEGYITIKIQHNSFEIIQTK